MGRNRGSNTTTVRLQVKKRLLTPSFDELNPGGKIAPTSKPLTPSFDELNTRGRITPTSRSPLPLFRVLKSSSSTRPPRLASGSNNLKILLTSP
ncbi:hypothetical protein AtEden1_Chr1g0042421 [Arabidopsis thaliana]